MAAGGLISLPCKLSEPVPFNEHLGKFIANEYHENPGDYAAAVSELSSLRDAVCVKAAEPHESGVRAIQRYLGQFTWLMKHFPISNGEAWNGVPPQPLQINFAWMDTLGGGGGGVFGKKKPIAMANHNYERACVLYNLAAVQSQLGKAQDLSSDGGRKTAASSFQDAAVVLKGLSNFIAASFKAIPAPDLHPALLLALSDLMLAQAQEALWSKCVAEQRKDNIVAKVAAQVADMYDRAGRAIGARAEADKTWAMVAAAKRFFFAAEAQQRQAAVARAADKHGEVVSRLRQAAVSAQQAAKAAAGTPFDPKAMVDGLMRQLALAERDNQLIYVQLVPEFASCVLHPLHVVICHGSSAQPGACDGPGAGVERQASACVRPA